MSFNWSDRAILISDYCENNFTPIYSPKFSECLKYFLVKSLPLTILAYSMTLITTITNLILIYLLIKKNCTQIVFDRILLSHAFVDFITNLFDLPLYHLISIFNFFPFDKYICFYYLLIDNCTSTIEILHFFYMSYARIRCVVSPKLFQSEFLFRNSNPIIALIWIVCLLFWTPIVYFYSFKIYVEGTCTVDFKNPYEGIIFIFIGYHVPLLFTICATIFVILTIKAKIFTLNQYTGNTIKRTKKISLGRHIKTLLFDNPQVKLSIIIFVFILCYFPYSTILVVNAFHGVSPFTFNLTDILAYSASMWNPILILTLNYKFFSKKNSQDK